MNTILNNLNDKIRPLLDRYAPQIKQARYFGEYAALRAFMLTSYILPAEKFSDLGGWLARTVGPHLPTHKTALSNLNLVFPEWDDETHEDIALGMWDNLGRLVAEYENLDIIAPDIEVTGQEHLQRAMDEKKQVILFSAHIGNWEVMAPCLMGYGLKLDLVYRAPNNPRVDALLNKYRTQKGKLKTIAKSRAGTRTLVERLRDGHSIGILIDQKYNEGINIPFFDKPAMASPAFIQLGQKYDCAVLPFRVERINNTEFRLHFYAPLELFDDQNQPRPVETVMGEAHTLLEGWIRETPEQWLWLHRRWDMKRASAKQDDDEFTV